ncbi:MAG: ribonucleoside triphosphate reductase, partial [Treponemataceae bacterium]|nr:ribonucleoside triphosphate reductase [Treponemataceae bacterium]
MSDQTYQPEQSVFPEWRSFLGKSSEPETQSFIKQVVKRNGALESYDRRKIENAIGKAVEAVEKRANPDKAIALTDSVEERLRLLLAGRRAHSIPAIEEIQDIVENVLIAANEVEIAKAYI